MSPRTYAPPPALPAPLTAAQVLRAHQRLGGLYEVWGLAFHAPAHRMAIKRAALRNGERFLEVGVGSGLTFLPLVLGNPAGENQGVDFSEAMLGRCRERLERSGARHCRLQQADARELPFPSDRFDLLLCCYLLDALTETDQDRALEEFRRVLRPGGRLILVQMTRGGLPLYHLLASWAPLLLGGSRPVSLGPRSLQAGFRDVSQVLCKRLGLVSELVRGVKA